jgi:hypothetical protein
MIEYSNIANENNKTKCKFPSTPPDPNIFSFYNTKTNAESNQ